MILLPVDHVRLYVAQVKSCLCGNDQNSHKEPTSDAFFLLQFLAAFPLPILSHVSGQPLYDLSCLLNPWHASEECHQHAMPDAVK